MHGKHRGDFFPPVEQYPFTITSEQKRNLCYELQKLGAARTIVTVNNTRHAQYLARKVLKNDGMVIASPEQRSDIRTWAVDL